MGLVKVVVSKASLSQKVKKTISLQKIEILNPGLTARTCEKPRMILEIAILDLEQSNRNQTFSDSSMSQIVDKPHIGSFLVAMISKPSRIFEFLGQ